MTTTALPLPRSRFPVVLALIVLGIVAAAVCVPNIHAVERHGISASDAAFCFSGGGAVQLRATNPLNGRCATIAWMAEHFYVRIQEADGREVTMFCKEKMSCLEQVKQYLRNRGYSIPQ